MKIKIWETEQGDNGYMFNIWIDEEAEDEAESDDGGLCIGSYEEAIEMASEQAKNLLKIN